MAAKFEPPIPVLRSFDEAKARDFYCGFLGFEVLFEHRFEPGTPLYLAVKRGPMVIHLSEHHGDATPGATLFIRMQGIREFQEGLLAQQYGFARPGLTEQPWGIEMTLADPFHNRLRFCEQPE
jgi:hypothetical protein